MTHDIKEYSLPELVIVINYFKEKRSGLWCMGKCMDERLNTIYSDIIKYCELNVDIVIEEIVLGVKI